VKKFDPELFGPLLGGTARAWRLKLDERLKPLGLSQAKWRTLLLLSRAPEPLTQSQIAQQIGVEEPTLVALLHRLEEAGWVIRRSSPHDRRCKTVHLQRRAQRAIDQIAATALRLRHELIKDIPAREMQTCMRVLEQLRDRINDAAAENGTNKLNARGMGKWPR
jgi:MarR family transcriptional regulator, transcriptional regulator for hemolysin